MRVVSVSGSRSLKFKRPQVIKILDENIRANDFVIAGGAEGVDEITKIYCDNRGIKYKDLLPINKYYKKLPYTPLYYLARDKQIVDISDLHISIWDGVSNGTKFTRDYAKEIGKTCLCFTI